MAMIGRTSQLVDMLATVFDRRGRLPNAYDKRPIVEQCQALITATGEASALRLSASILHAFREMDEDARIDFFTHLGDDLDIDPDAVVQAAEDYKDERSRANLAALFDASEPSRQILFRKLNQVEGATADLVRMRKSLLDLRAAHPAFGRIDLDLVHLLSSWFNRGFLVLSRINWQTSATILEKIIAYEAVHAINDWEDLRRRTQPVDRRCYAYFHPAMPDDPLIFVEVALTKGIPTSIQSVLAEDRTPMDHDTADTAVFYSISNCQAGLAGISFGNSLLKQVVADLAAEMPNLKNFVTLSPMPGLNRWMTELADEDDVESRAILDAAAIAENDPEPLAGLAEYQRALAARYLVDAKRADGLPRDPVARFHLGNGASVENVLAMADLSEKGLEQSSGAMVNYRYDLATSQKNSETFATDQRVAHTRAIQSLLKTKSRSKTVTGKK